MPIFNTKVGIAPYLGRIWFAISLPRPPNPFPTHIQSHIHKMKFPQASKTSGAQTTPQPITTPCSATAGYSIPSVKNVTLLVRISNPHLVNMGF
jgi:hypothetical protein